MTLDSFLVEVMLPNSITTNKICKKNKVVFFTLAYSGSFQCGLHHRSHVSIHLFDDPEHVNWCVTYFHQGYIPHHSYINYSIYFINAAVQLTYFTVLQNKRIILYLLLIHKFIIYAEIVCACTTTLWFMAENGKIKTI